VTAIRLVASTAALVAYAGDVDAYPQFQLSRDQTCSACHLSPAGGGLLSENGLVTADAISQFGTPPEFFYNAFTPPHWLALGGDLRGAGGFDSWPKRDVVAFPMQADVYAAATVSGFSLHVTAGLRDPQYHNEARTIFISREHWLQWDQHPGEGAGLFVRVGRFMPVFGLRFVEHPAYDRRYGGTPLYGEAYGAAVEYVHSRWEVHATGFLHDPLEYSSELGNGAALYAEARPTSTTAVGLEAKLDSTPDDRKVYGGITAKQLVGPVLLELEAQIIHDKIALGGYATQAVGYLLASWFIGAFMIDLGIGAYEPDLHVRYLDQEAVDLNVHWFATSHLELIVTNRLQMLELGEGGLTSGYSLLQLHYRL
jgi:hypothetical protein